MFKKMLFSFLSLMVLASVVVAEPAPTPESHLLLPYFEVSLEGLEQMTFLSFVNSGNDTIFLTAKLYSNWAVPMLEVPIQLQGREVKSINLHEWVMNGNLTANEKVCSDGSNDCMELTHLQEALSGQPSTMTQLYYGSVVEEGVATGFITIEADNGFLPESDVLWGDYFYSDPVENFAQGQRLVRLEPDLSCADLCYRHSIRFLEGGGFSGGTKLTIWNWDGQERVPSEFPEPQFLLGQTSIDVYNEKGDLIDVVPQVALLPSQTLLVSDLNLDKSVGWIDLTTEQKSTVSGFYRAMGRFSVGVPAWCLPCDPCKLNSPCYEAGHPECTSQVCIPAEVRVYGDGRGRVNSPFSLEYRIFGSAEVTVDVSNLPDGLIHSNSRIAGIPNEEKDFTITVTNDCGQDEVTIPIDPDGGGSTTTLTVIKEVINDDGGTATVDQFELFIDNQSVTSGQPETVAPGTYTVSEINLPGYTAGAWTGDCNAAGRVTLAGGDRKTCRIVNDDQPARLTLIKQVINDDGGTARVSDFPLFVDAQQVTSGVPTQLPAGTYQASEQNLNGYIAGAWTGDCNANGRVTLALGDDKTCVITNDDETTRPAYLTLIKTVVNDDGGSARVSDFQLSISGRAVASRERVQLSPGSYTAAEQNLPGYSAGPWTGDCAANGSITLAEGDDKVCRIVNDDEPTTLKLIKRVINDDGGSAVVGDFDLFIGNRRVNSGAVNKVNPGSYTVRENNLPGYSTAGWTGDCSPDGQVNLALGDDKTCIITNDDNPPEKAYLTLIKRVTNDNGGTAQPSDFALFINSQQVASGVRVQLSPGSYTASENNLPGYSAGAWTGDCAADGSVTLAKNDDKVCTITNDDQPARIKLIKYVVNDHGGTAKASDFNLYVGSKKVTTGIFYDVTPGTHTAREDNLPGYTAGTWGGDCAYDGTVTVALGETKVCDITNDDQPARIKVIKHVVNDDGGTATVSDFDLYIGNKKATSGVFYDVTPGTHTVSETNLPGYTAGSWGYDCSANGTVTVALGESKVCDITNDDQPSTLKLIKWVVNDHGGTAKASDFDLFIGGQKATSGVAYEKAPGSYTVSETNLPGYEAGLWTGDCSSDGKVTLGLGEHKVCEITNDDIPPTIKLIKTVVNDDGGTASVSDFNLFVGNKAVTSGTTYEMSAGTYTASEQNLPGYTAGPWTGDCAADGTVTLGLGEHKVCEITNDDDYVCDPTPTFRIWNGDVSYNDPHRYSHYTEVSFNFEVDGEVDGEVQIFWRNGGSTYIKKRISVSLDCDDAAKQGSLYWDSTGKSHHPGHGAKYEARLVIGNQVISSIPLN